MNQSCAPAGARENRRVGSTHLSRHSHLVWGPKAGSRGLLQSRTTVSVNILAESSAAWAEDLIPPIDGDCGRFLALLLERLDYRN
jgi:hypothetical protein